MKTERTSHTRRAHQPDISSHPALGKLRTHRRGRGSDSGVEWSGVRRGGVEWGGVEVLLGPAMEKTKRKRKSMLSAGRC